MNAPPQTLAYTDELPHPIRRIAVAGVSGSGKTTLARKIAAIADLRHVELDGLYHGAHWQPRPEFLDDVHQFIAGDRWVTEWQYDKARPLIVDRCDVIVWLDLPFWTTTFPRVVRRTLRRRIRHETLWNNNTEPPLRTLFSNPDHIIRWAISHRHKSGAAVEHLAKPHPELTIVRLRTSRQVRRWLTGPVARTQHH